MFFLEIYVISIYKNQFCVNTIILCRSLKIIHKYILLDSIRLQKHFAYNSGTTVYMRLLFIHFMESYIQIKYAGQSTT